MTDLRTFCPQTCQLCPDQRFVASGLSLADFVGAYSGPGTSDASKVTIAIEGDELVWRNAAGAAWNLTFDQVELHSSPTSPYGERPIQIEPVRDSDGQPIYPGQVAGLRFNNQMYRKL